MAEDRFLFVDLTGSRKLLQILDEMPDIVRAILREKITQWTETMRDQVIQNIQERLKIKTGRLEESVRIEFTEDGVKFNGHVYIAGVPYAQAQEKGAVVPPHMIYPVNAKALAFIAATGDKVFAAHVFHPGGIIPATNFMRDAYRFVSPKITRGLRYYIVETINRRLRG
jgi:hypothetical protein